MSDEEIDAAARVHHDEYERLAAERGYDTREESRLPWDQLTPAMQRLMRDCERASIEAFLALHPPREGAEPVAEMTLRELQRLAMDECVVAEWPDYRFAEELMFLASEVSEAFEAWRDYHDFAIHYGPDGKPEGVPIELADVLIGLLYNAEKHGFDLAEALAAKHAYNLTRNYRLSGRVPT